MFLVDLLKKGSVWYGVPGNTAREFIENMINAIKLPSGVKPEDFALACTRRELVSSTAMGLGIAFPHPDLPYFTKASDSFIALAYPRFPVEWNANDGLPVKAVFLVGMHDKREHLMALAELAKLCTTSAFYSALMAESTLKALSQFF